VTALKTAFVYPGQGSQKVGMGQDLYEAFPAARRVFDIAEQASGLPLKKLCFAGPEDQLARTDICQPAIFAVSAATLAVMEELLSGEQLQAIRPAYMAGLSLGEYTALYAAGAMDLATAARLVSLRGKFMQAEAEATPSAMICVLGMNEQQALRLCQAAANGQVLTCANFNCPGQIVLSGRQQACQRAQELAEQFGASGVVPLKVAGAFHSELMQPAAKKLGEELNRIKWADLSTQVVANVDFSPYEGPAFIKGKLLAQLVSPVRWQQSMEWLIAQGIETFYEIGPGRVLAGLMRRTNQKMKFSCIGDRKSIEKLANS